MKKILVVALTAAGFAAQANAEGFYVGASLGSASIVDLGDAVAENNAAWIALGAVSSSATYTARTGASKIFGGAQVNPNVALEFGYANLGTHTADVTVIGPVPPNVTEKYQWKATALFLDAVGSAKLGESFSLFGKLGFASTKIELDYSFRFSTGPTGSASDSESEVVLKYGLGGDYAINKSLSARFEYELYSDVGERDTTGESDISMISLGLTYKF